MHPSRPLHERLRQVLSLDSSQFALVQALAIGLLAGLVSVLFRRTTGWIGSWRNHIGLHPSTWYEWLILPGIGLAGGLIAGHLTVGLAPEAKGSGIPQIKQALAEGATPLRRRTIWVKFLGAATGIGSGLSMGREGPTVQIGGGIGEWISRWQPCAPKDRRSLMAAGAGAGVAAAFNAPIAGFVFIIEELLQDWSTTTMATAVLATVTASIVSRVLAGNIYVYRLPETSFQLAELPFYVALGVLAGLLGVGFIRAVLGTLDGFARWRLPRAWHPAVAGLLTGVVGLFLPMALGGSHELAEMAFHGELPLLLLLGALATKFGLTVLAYGSGAPGGIFAPTLVIGSCLGAGVGTLSAALVGSGHGAIAGFAFVGMGALFTAVARAPITAILIVFELTGHYDHILPLMLACVVAHLVAHSLGSTSIYDALLVRDGVHLPEPVSPDVMTAVTVAAVMTAPVATIAPDESLAAVRGRFRHATHHGFPVSDAGQPLGMITGADLMRATVQGLPDDTPALTLASRPVITVLTTDSLRAAVRRMTAADIGRLVVVAPGSPPTIVGIVTRSDLLAGVDRGEPHPLSPAPAHGGQ